MKKFRTALASIMILMAVILPLGVSAQVTVPAPPDIAKLLPNLAQQLQAAKATITAEDKSLSKVPTVPTSNPLADAKNTGISIFGYNIGISWNQLLITLAQVVINQIVNSTVKWMQSGFNGQPVFITDPGAYFGSIANGVTGDYINKIAPQLCSPLQANVRIALARFNTAGYSPQCTLTGIAANLENFYKSFSKGGGLSTWFQVTQNSANNPYGAFLTAQANIDSQNIAQASAASDMLNWGQGFLSQQECKERNASMDDLTKWYNAHPNDDTVPPTYNANYAPGACIKYGPIQTPGSTIKTHLDEALPANNLLRQLTTADQFDKLLTALGSGLLQKFVFGGGGLLGKSGSNANGGGTSNTPTQQTPTISCSADKDKTVMGVDSVTWLATSDLPNAAVDFTWVGEGIDGQIGPSASTTYMTKGYKVAYVIASTTLLDDVGDYIPSSQKTYPKQVCTGSVHVSPYNPLQVSCAPNVGVSKLEVPVIWTAKITGGSGNFDVLKWDGSQAHAPGCSNDLSRIYPQDNTSAPHVVWKYTVKHAEGLIQRTECNNPSESTFEDNSLGTDGAFTSMLTRKYIGAEDHLGTVTAQITVIDKDPDVDPVTVQCSAGVFIND